jgi:hypothetical protein
VSTDDEVVPDKVDPSDFYDTFFSETEYSVSSQYSSCSAGQFVLEPYDVEQPVVQIRLNGRTAASYTRGSIFAAANEALEDMYSVSNVGHIADHAIFCLPAGLSGPPFRATSAVNGFWTAANSTSWCTNPAVLMHELGHHLGLGHAGEREDEYGDESSIMGQTYLSDDTSGNQRCFNGQNLWHLGWFQERAIEIFPFVKSPQTTELATYIDFTETVDGQAVVIKVADFYLVYNRKKSYNSQTGDFPDMVTIVQQVDGLHSSLLTGLDDTEENSLFTKSMGPGLPDLTIQICGKRTNGTWVGKADSFRVAFGLGAEPPCDQQAIASSSDEPGGPPPTTGHDDNPPTTAEGHDSNGGSSMQDKDNKQNGDSSNDEDEQFGLFSIFSFLISAVLAVALLSFAILRWRRKRAEKNEQHGTDDESITSEISDDSGPSSSERIEGREDDSCSADSFYSESEMSSSLENLTCSQSGTSCLEDSTLSRAITSSTQVKKKLPPGQSEEFYVDDSSLSTKDAFSSAGDKPSTKVTICTLLLGKSVSLPGSADSSERQQSPAATF